MFSVFVVAELRVVGGFGVSPEGPVNELLENRSLQPETRPAITPKTRGRVVQTAHVHPRVRARRCGVVSVVLFWCARGVPAAWVRKKCACLVFPHVLSHQRDGGAIVKLVSRRSDGGLFGGPWRPREEAAKEEEEDEEGREVRDNLQYGIV